MNNTRPDAVRSPLYFAGPGGSSARLAKLHEEFASLLQAPRLYVRHQGAEHFITGDPVDTLNFPNLDARAGEPRYEWDDRGDGLLFGYLKDYARTDRI